VEQRADGTEGVNMSDTPRTDAVEQSFPNPAPSTEYIHCMLAALHFARQLERENRELLEALKMVLAIMCDKEICGHFLPREIREVVEPAIAKAEGK
jgi:hypothetical protein